VEEVFVQFLLFLWRTWWWCRTTWTRWPSWQSRLERTSWRFGPSWSQRPSWRAGTVRAPRAERRPWLARWY